MAEQTEMSTGGFSSFFTELTKVNQQLEKVNQHMEIIREKASKGSSVFQKMQNINIAANFAGNLSSASAGIDAWLAKQGMLEAGAMGFSGAWGQAIQAVMQGLSPLLVTMQQAFNSGGFQAALASLQDAFSKVAFAAGMAFQIIQAVGGFIIGNWSILSPIIYGVATAILAFTVITRAASAILKIHSLLQKVSTAMITIQKNATVSNMVTQTAVAQTGLNAALLACPLVWFVEAILAVIAVINRLAETSFSVMGAVSGAITTGLAVVGNVLIGFLNTVIFIMHAVYTGIAMLANFLANVFTDPLGAVGRLFLDFCNFILACVQSLVGWIDAIFGSSMSDGLQEMRDNMRAWKEETLGAGIVVMDEMSFGKIESISYGDAFEAGNSFGEGLQDQFSNMTFENSQMPTNMQMEMLSDMQLPADVRLPTDMQLPADMQMQVGIQAQQIGSQLAAPPTMAEMAQTRFDPSLFGEKPELVFTSGEWAQDKIDPMTFVMPESGAQSSEYLQSIADDVAGVREDGALWLEELRLLRGAQEGEKPAPVVNFYVTNHVNANSQTDFQSFLDKLEAALVESGQIVAAGA